MPITPNAPLERLVRPFGDGVRSYAVAGKPSPPITSGSEATLVVEASVPVEVITLAALTLRQQKNTEIDRRSHIQRVTNPEDPDQFVDVEVIDEIEFEDNLKARMKLFLNNPEQEE